MGRVAVSEPSAVKRFVAAEWRPAIDLDSVRNARHRNRHQARTRARVLSALLRPRETGTFLSLPATGFDLFYQSAWCKLHATRCHRGTFRDGHQCDPQGMRQFSGWPLAMGVGFRS
jgi:hypothetical protein